MWIRAASSAVILLGFGLNVARADIISPNPTYPPAGGVFSGAGAGCFTIASVCGNPATLIIDKVTSDNFSTNQELTADVTVLLPLTTLPPHSVPLGTVTLTGTFEVVLEGRTGPTATGTWTGLIESLDLSGMFSGMPISVRLNTSDTSGGTTTILPDGSDFQIHSFFDIFADVHFAGLEKDVGPLPANLVPAPEPGTLALLGIPLLGLALLRRPHRVLAGPH